jgi:hypothetical protein
MNNHEQLMAAYADLFAALDELRGAVLTYVYPDYAHQKPQKPDIFNMFGDMFGHSNPFGMGRNQ